MDAQDQAAIKKIIDDALVPKSRDQTLREMIHHEDQLRDDRLSYLLTLNGFLFAALAFGWRVKVKDGSDALVFLLAGVGLVVGLSALAGQITSNAAVTLLRMKNEDADPPLVGLTGDEEQKGGDDGVGDGHVNGFFKLLVPWKVLPGILMLAWAAVVVVRLAIILLR
jgi:hypothetical protein